MTKCEKCECKKSWNGDDIICPFQNSQKFGDNWSCGIISKIKNLCNLAIENKDHRLQHQYCNDQNYITIKTDNGDSRLGLCLWISWYKSRGRTEAMWILDENNPPRQPNFEDLEAIIKYYSQSEDKCSN